MLRAIYSLALYLALPFLLLRLLYRCLREGDASALRIGQRLGFCGQLPSTLPSPRIVLHAVSLGEMNAAEPLLRQLRQRYPGHGIVVTSTTPTGLARGMEILPGMAACVALPYDLPDAVARFLDGVKPELMLVLENEIWPNLLLGCASRGIPVAIVNARLSPSSMVGYRRWRLLFAPALDKIRLVAAQDEVAAKAWQELGLGNVLVAGNLKYDALPDPKELRQRADALAGRLGLADRPVWMAASTHPGEEQQVMAALLMVRSSHPDSVLVWAPRHPWRRSAAIAELCRKHGLHAALRSRGEDAAGTGVFLLDTLGELQDFYATADAAFVGGSLEAHGGHNVLEAAAAGVPALCGPHTFNFTALCHDMEKADVLLRVHDGYSLGSSIRRLFTDAQLRRGMADNASAFVAGRSGASVAVCDALEKLLPAK